MAVQFHVVASESMVERRHVTEDIERRIREREQAKQIKSPASLHTLPDKTTNGKPQ